MALNGENKGWEEMPAVPAGVAGKSDLTSGKHKISVSNAHGYLCHITSEGVYDCSPKLVYALFTNPDNTGVFRDIKAVTSRKVISESQDGVRVVEIEQLGEVKMLFKAVHFKTLLTVTEDGRDPNNLMTHFELIRSDVLGAFNGTWHLRPIKRKGKGDVIGTHLTLEQDVTPRGVPSFMKNVPVLGHVLRGICVRAVKRMLEDISAAIAKLEAGKKWEDVVKPRPQSVQSHALTQLDLSDSEEDASQSAGASPEASPTPKGAHAAAQPSNVTSEGTGEAAHSGHDSEQPAQTTPKKDGGFWDAKSWMQE